MQLFYHPKPESENWFDTEESRHIAKVLRYRAGEILTCTDGIGHKYELVLTHTDFAKVEFEIQSKLFIPNDELNIHIGIGAIKSEERTEWMLEKLVEIGVSSISLLQCERTEFSSLKETRLHKILLSAIKQSKRYWLPELNIKTKFPAFLEKEATFKFVAHLIEGQATTNITDILANNPCPANVIMLIGPEGDFTNQEVQLALTKEYKAVTLGKYVLRTETAAVAAVAGIRAVLGK